MIPKHVVLVSAVLRTLVSVPTTRWRLPGLRSLDNLRNFKVVDISPEENFWAFFILYLSKNILQKFIVYGIFKDGRILCNMFLIR